MSDFALHQDDCLEVMPTLTAGSVAMVFADLPYQCTSHKWDVGIDVASLWINVGLCIKANAVVVLSSVQPFTTDIIQSNRKQFRYDLVWQKSNVTGFLNAKRSPLRCHETLCVFYKRQPTYNPQMTHGHVRYGKRQNCHASNAYGAHGAVQTSENDGSRYPKSVIAATSVKRQSMVHPTQKPVSLLEWLIATYTNPGDTVLDPVMGSGTTGHACANLGRKFIGIEKDPTYFTAAKARIEAAYASPKPPQGALAV